MCGRLMLEEDTTTITQRFEAGILVSREWASEMRQNDITPGREIPVIAKIAGRGICLNFIEWGWYFYRMNDKGRRVKQPIINARSDTILANLENPRRIYKEGLAKPLIIPANGFYEWVEEDGKKVRYLFRHPEERIMAIGGFTVAQKEDDGGYTDRVTIITTEPTDQMRFTGHDRMPLILNPQQELEWLSQEAASRPYLEEMFAENKQPLVVEKMG